MFARVTQFEIDTLRISLDEALQRFQEMILPEVRKVPGYRGVFVMRTPEGKGVVVSLWATAEAAQTGVESGYYDGRSPSSRCSSSNRRGATNTRSCSQRRRSP
jgi:hypothetical protein